MQKKNYALISILIACASGCLLTLAFAPYQYGMLAWVCPAILLLLWQKASPKLAFWQGLGFGIGFFGCGVWWIFISIHVHGHTVIPLALLLTVLFMIILAFFPALQGYLLQKMVFSASPKKFLLVFPASWVLSEWIRSWFLSGFPWLSIGYSQIYTPLQGYAPLFSLYGISFITLFINGLVVTCIQYKEKSFRVLSLFAFIFVLGLGYYLSQVKWTSPQVNQLSISLIQGNISQSIKWEASHIDETIEKYYALTLPLLGHNLIVWPEGAIPVPYSTVKNIVSQLDILAKQYKSTLIVGIPLTAEENNYYYNAMIALGKGTGSYTKRHLVPFGEYVPFEKYLRGLIHFFNLPMSSYLPGSSHQGEIRAGNTLIAPTICYEIAYPDLVLSYLPHANLLLTISDDSWFGHSNASAQHLEMGQMRALETGRPLLFATNDGITALVNSNGKLMSSLPRFKTAVLSEKVNPVEGLTPLIAYGTNPILLLVALLLALGLCPAKKAKNFHYAPAPLP